MEGEIERLRDEGWIYGGADRKMDEQVDGQWVGLVLRVW